MRKNKPHKQKFKIVLDAAFAGVDMFPKIKKKANLVHIVFTYGFSKQVEDEEIYQKAIQEDRFVLTINFKDFKKLVKKGKPGIIGIESQLSNEDIDKLVADFISGKDPEEYKGKAVKI